MEIKEAISTYAKQLNKRSVPTPEREETEALRHDIIRDNFPEPQPPEPVVVEAEPIPVRIVDESTHYEVNDIQINVLRMDPAIMSLPYAVLGKMEERTSVLIQNIGAAAEGNVYIGKSRGIVNSVNAFRLSPGQFITLRYGGDIYVTVDAATTIQTLVEYKTRIAKSKRKD